MTPLLSYPQRRAPIGVEGTSALHPHGAVLICLLVEHILSGAQHGPRRQIHPPSGQSRTSPKQAQDGAPAFPRIASGSTSSLGFKPLWSLLSPSSELVYCSAASATPRSASFTVPCPSSVDSNLEPSQSCSEHLNLGPCAGPDWLMVEYRGTATRRAWHHSCKATLGLAGGRACWGMCLAGSRGCARSGSLSTLAATSIAMCAPRSSRNAFASS